MKTKPYTVFYVICGLIYPFILIGALIISFITHWALGILTTGILSYWMVYAFTTTCCRCSFYGTGRCGLTGKVVPLFLKKKSLKGLPIWRIKLNYYNDLMLMLYINLVYLLTPVVYPFILLTSILVYIYVYKDMRFHGLMHLLKKEEKIKKLQLNIIK